MKMERNEPTREGLDNKDNYVEWVTTRGKLVPMSAGRALSLGEASIEGRWELWVRFQVEIENYISKSQKLVINNKFYTLTRYELIGEKKRYYYLQLNEKR